MLQFFATPHQRLTRSATNASQPSTAHEITHEPDNLDEVPELSQVSDDEEEVKDDLVEVPELLQVDDDDEEEEDGEDAEEEDEAESDDDEENLARFEDHDDQPLPPKLLSGRLCPITPTQRPHAVWRLSHRPPTRACL